MDALQFLKTTINDIAAKLDSVAQTIDGVPIIGDYLAAPFYIIADSLEWACDLIQNVDEWWEWLKTGFDALPVWTDVVKAIEATWPLLTMTPAQLYDLIKGFIPALPAWLPTSLADMKTLVLSWIPALPDWLPTSLDELVTLVYEKVVELFAWLPDSFDALWDMINTKISETWSILSMTWEQIAEHIEPFLEIPEITIDWIIETVGNAFESILDYVFKED